jgi:hypothetical protein
VDAAFEIIAEYRKRIAENKSKAESMAHGLDLFSMDTPEYKDTEVLYNISTVILKP